MRLGFSLSLSRRTLGVIVLALLVLLFPVLPGVKLSLVVNANLAGEYALIAFSLVILTGWVGQISLGQGAFVGIGAFTTGLLVRNLHIPFPLNLPFVALISAGPAVLLGVVALRIRGLYLAVATLIFAWMADAYLFSSEWFIGAAGTSTIPNKTIGRRGTITFFDLSNKKVFYFVIVAMVAATWYAALNLRVSKTGRAFFAIHGSETAAVSLGIDVTRYKLLAFALSGALAGIAGNLTMTDFRAVTPVLFQFTVSLFYLSIAVVGGIGSLGGAVASAILFAGLNSVSFLNGWLDIVGVGLLLAVLLLYPGGLGALGPALWPHVAPRLGMVARPARAAASWLGRPVSRRARRDVAGQETRPAARPPGRFRSRVAGWFAPVLRLVPARRYNVERRALDYEGLEQREAVRSLSGGGNGAEPGPSAEPVLESGDARDWHQMKLPRFVLPGTREERAPVLEAANVVVRFGGLTAVNGASLMVREHEIVGLIGPNGAGKTTLFNSISGLNEPAEGTIRIFGEDATTYPVHVRAQMGVGRTFQLIQLFPQLTVFENLLVATHIHNDTGVFSHLALTLKAIEAEREARDQVRQVEELLGLAQYADRRVAGLPFGILRQVEIARALVTRSPFLMLDEPASGLDNNETDELMRLLYFVRAKLGVTILLIEHDVRMVTAVSDYMYVLSQGRMIADGTPEEMQRNPDVIHAYLGEATGAAIPEMAGA